MISIISDYNKKLIWLELEKLMDNKLSLNEGPLESCFYIPKRLLLLDNAMLILYAKTYGSKHWIFSQEGMFSRNISTKTLIETDFISDELKKMIVRNIDLFENI